MSRISTCLSKCKAEGRSALVTYLTMGDPTPASTPSMVAALSRGGADILELGIPFSDPAADGPVLQAAMKRALDAGVRFEDALALVRALRAGELEGADPELPVVLFGYANPFFSQPKLPQRLQRAGVDGLLCVDLPPEEGREFFAGLKAVGVDPILLCAPNSSDERVRFVSQQGAGFLYYVALTGVTGSAWADPEALTRGVARVVALSELPVCAGFGVDGPESLARLAGVAEGVVVGSAIVKRFAEASQEGHASVEAFVATLAKACRDIAIKE